jgi:hypothetical protein
VPGIVPSRRARDKQRSDPREVVGDVACGRPRSRGLVSRARRRPTTETSPRSKKRGAGSTIRPPREPITMRRDYGVGQFAFVDCVRDTP